MLMMRTRLINLQDGCKEAKIKRELIFPDDPQNVSNLYLSSLIIVLVLLLVILLSLSLFLGCNCSSMAF